MCSRDLTEDITGDLARCERKPRNEHNSVAFTIIHDVVPFAIGKTVSVLDRDDGNNLAPTLDMLPRNVRQSNEANFSLVSQLGQSFQRGVKGHERIRNMQLI